MVYILAGILFTFGLCLINVYISFRRKSANVLFRIFHYLYFMIHFYINRYTVSHLAREERKTWRQTTRLASCHRFHLPVVASCRTKFRKYGSRLSYHH